MVRSYIYNVSYMVEIDSSLSENNICFYQLHKCSTSNRCYPSMTFQACLPKPTLEETLSIPTMLSMTWCPKQLVKRLQSSFRLPRVSLVSRESLFSHLFECRWTLLRAVQLTNSLSTIYHPLHRNVYDVDRILWRSFLLVIVWSSYYDYAAYITM